MNNPENRHVPAPPPQGITFDGHRYNNLPDHIVMGMQRVQALEQAGPSARTGGSLRRNQGDQAASLMPQVGFYPLQICIV